MKIMLAPHEVVAKVWDDYLHRFGAEQYVMARYLTPPTPMSMIEEADDESGPRDAPDNSPAGAS